jgi:endonuclease YncB( thermonuclease family)
LTRDQFGRLVGQVQRADGCLLNLLLLQRGSHWRRDRSGLETH